MSTQTTNGLADKLNNLVESLTDLEVENYKLLLGIAAGGLAPHGEMPTGGRKKEAFETVLNLLATFVPAGIVWKGRPDFLTEDLLAGLQQEGLNGRELAKPTDRYLLTCGGPIADRLALSDELEKFISSLAPGMIPTGIASYLYYEGVGAGLDPHIDTETFTLNLIMMLHHSYEQSPSRLLVFPHNADPLQIQLLPGECVLLFAGGTVHAREDLKENENIRLLTIGFRPQ